MDDKSEDQQWLDGLAGRSKDKLPASAIQAQARVIRDVVLRKGQETSFETTEAGFQRLLGEAQERRLLRAERRLWNPLLGLQRIYEVLALPGSVLASAVIVLGLGITVVLQSLEPPKSTGYDAVRGGVSPEMIVLRVDDPKLVVEEWQSELMKARVDHSVSFESPQRVFIRFRLTSRALDIMQSRRIQPPAGEWCTLVIEPAKALQH